MNLKIIPQTLSILVTHEHQPHLKTAWEILTKYSSLLLAHGVRFATSALTSRFPRELLIVRQDINKTQTKISTKILTFS